MVPSEVRLCIQLLDKPSRLLLRYLSYLNGNFVPFSLVAALLHEIDLEPILAVLQPILTYNLASIVKREEKYLGLQIHESVQLSCRNPKVWQGTEGMDDATILADVVQVFQSLVPRVGEGADDWREDVFLYVPHAIVLLPFLQTAGQFGSVGEFYLVAGLGRFFGHGVQSYQLAVEFLDQALDMSESVRGLPESDIAGLLFELGSS